MNISYNNHFKSLSKSISDEDLLEIEKKYGFTFPQDIRDHYLTYNGGEPEMYVFIDEGYKYIIQRFIPIKHRKTMDSEILEDILDMLRTADKILPDWLIPFADDPGGNLYCFSLNKDEEGVIYFWEHDYDFGEDPEEHVGYLAPSLKSFIEAMAEDK
ncbi:MAG: SMI1/KNR4 family protein [Clostridia bacterium]|nr:SMI1/KNR4 family protein [Clostridia bacterium]